MRFSIHVIASHDVAVADLNGRGSANGVDGMRNHDPSRTRLYTRRATETPAAYLGGKHRAKPQFPGLLPSCSARSVLQGSWQQERQEQPQTSAVIS